MIVDHDLRVSFFNAAAETIWGLDRAKCSGGHVRRLGLAELHRVDGDDAPEKHASEVTIERPDGSRIRAALSVSHVEIGGQSRSIAFVRDITAEIVRRERMALLNLVADKTNRAVVVTDRNLKDRLRQRRVYRMFGYSTRGSAGPAANRTAGRPTYRPPDAGQVAALDRRRKPAARRKSSPTTRTATRSGSRPASRRSATRAGGSNTCSRC